MIQTITPTNLILHLYNESPADEVGNLNNQLLIDEESRSEMEQLHLVKKALDRLSYEPSPESLQRILDYSKKTRF
jgi:hypothetical protein